ncbi:hypothetical protein [Sphingomonas morindae]|uniref:Uncharacterized protein n=1 Tax=Sphingomonas morindae TaxID=1541170 RepID=A0ABY4XD34_9SPHN|nr:hypothetical protein [Sphingomonas morindae]USI74881.1 hypothetical protein LHA26_17055 [Sphingomonas morindae]
MSNWGFAAALIGLAAAAGIARADPAPFDLTGPTLRVSVLRGGRSLPIAAVPGLAAGDQLSVRADLPPDQAAHYLLIAAFLRGATNPPPEAWFSRVETWTKAGRAGLSLRVPPDAQQVLLFLAPETGGDFPTLRSAVRGKPGAFVRAAQDINQATLDRSRLDRYLAAVRAPAAADDPARLARITPVLARTLGIKINPDCLDKLPTLQASCLMQNQDALVLSDGHSSAISDALTGPGADLALQLAATPQGGLGFYSPYIGAIRDIIGIFSSLHTAKYQYIAALRQDQGDAARLILNAAPSFHNPKSVLVTALPAVAAAPPPPLSAGAEAICAGGASMLVPVTGAPLVFSTGYAHDLRLRVRDPAGHLLDLPAHADATQGDFVVAGAGPRLSTLAGPLTGTLHGQWGFDGYEGPSLALALPRPGQWQIAADEADRLAAGRAATLHLSGGAAPCVTGARLRLASGETRPVAITSDGAERLALALPLDGVEPGALTLLLDETGLDQPEALPLHAYGEAARPRTLTLRAGNAPGLLLGTRLDQVAAVTIAGQDWVPATLDQDSQGDRLTINPPAGAPALAEGSSATARIRFKDGRASTLSARVGPPLPDAMLVARAITAPADTGPLPIHLQGEDRLPAGGALRFSLRQEGAGWSGDEQIEIAPEANAAAAMILSFGHGLTQQDAQIAVARLDTAGAPAGFYGPLRYRVRRGEALGAWHPLAVLVRLPRIDQLRCPAAPEAGCTLGGDALYLIRGVAVDPGFTRALAVPDGFVGTLLDIPRPAGSTLYLRLRDDPMGIATIGTPTPQS